MEVESEEVSGEVLGVELEVVWEEVLGVELAVQSVVQEVGVCSCMGKD